MSQPKSGPWLIQLGQADWPVRYLTRTDDGALTWTASTRAAIGFASKAGAEGFARRTISGDVSARRRDF